MPTLPNKRLESSTLVQQFENRTINIEAGQHTNDVAVYALSISLTVCCCIIAVFVVFICCALKRRKSRSAGPYQNEYNEPIPHSTTSNIYASIDQQQTKLNSTVKNAHNIT
ncbi:hypothetical protein DPMN_135625 [Dreissena polymorpha]|uniref:Uncharacterized protein n=1 Tax=Dreissena polymorpha TaxID=45954 RepID=A0A9D4JD38_DREPO|nr:hypothetical protein DPMN_135625 [Dreissena polymorpha]